MNNSQFSFAEVHFWGYVAWLCLWGANAPDAPKIAFETRDIYETRAINSLMGRKTTAE